MNRLQRPGGVEVAYQVLNPDAPGIPLLLSHGFAATARMWDPNTDALSVDRPVIVWDQRGHGRSDGPESVDGYGEMTNVADMTTILDDAGVHRAALGGLSLGGYLSLAFHLAHPQRVAALMLVDTGPGYYKDDARNKWNDSVEDVARQLENGTLPTGWSAELAQAVHDHPEGLPYAARGALVQHDSRVIASLKTVAVPSLIVVGDRDTDYLAAADYMQRHIPDARKVVIEDAGHASNMDQADSFNTAVRAFLEQL